MSTSESGDARTLLRHTLATVAYRGAKAVIGAPPGFANFAAADTTRTPVRILAHMGDLYDCALSMARGNTAWHDSTPLAWDGEIARFFAALAAFDACLAGDQPLGVSVDRLFQGPVADSLTHIGQLAMLRRLAGAPVRGENYARARIAAGNVGPEHPGPRVEFD